MATADISHIEERDCVVVVRICTRIEVSVEPITSDHPGYVDAEQADRDLSRRIVAALGTAGFDADDIDIELEY